MVIMYILNIKFFSNFEVHGETCFSGSIGLRYV